MTEQHPAIDRSDYEYVIYKLRQRADEYYKQTHRQHHYSNGDAELDYEAAALLASVIEKVK